MCADIELLETKVMTYYNDKGTLPVKGDPIPNVKSTLVVLASTFLLSACTPTATDNNTPALSPIEYVNPYVGNISHLLVPTFPTIHLPNSMLRVYPEARGGFGNDLYLLRDG